LGNWLDLPAVPLPGDVFIPRRQTVLSGPSERFAVAPGREAEGYFHMPGGQSGHPLAPFYRKGHEAWVHGDPLPFLPGAAEYSLKLVPPTGSS
jgi:penicillin amidase